MHRILLLPGIFLVLVILVACSSEDNSEPITQTATLPSLTPIVDQAETLNDQPSKPAPTPGNLAVDYCQECHTNQEKLIASANPDQIADQATPWKDLIREAAPMEPWEKVWVNGKIFPASIHGLNGCLSCHRGVQDPDKEIAHQGVIRNPSRDPETTCGRCHLDIVAYSSNSLHSNVAGFYAAVNNRGLPGNHSVLESALEESCSDCHATCGDCHVSRPNVAGGGFFDGHLFYRTPSMDQNCVTCHGSRAGNEFLGGNQGQTADVHYQADLTCVSCHAGKELHGQPAACQDCHPGPEKSHLPPPGHRYAGVQSPRCESCHPAVSAGQDQVLMHNIHGSKLACQVCHSISYNNCFGCHVGSATATGEAAFELESSQLLFLIGRNPIQSYERPYQYVTVRHVPVAADTFAAYGTGLLSRFSEAETWKYATPHNIQRKTPQTESCNACHGNPSLFLTADKLAPEELNANLGVIVETVPPPITSIDQFP